MDRPTPVRLGRATNDTAQKHQIFALGRHASGNIHRFISNQNERFAFKLLDFALKSAVSSRSIRRINVDNDGFALVGCGWHREYRGGRGKTFSVYESARLSSYLGRGFWDEDADGGMYGAENTQQRTGSPPVWRGELLSDCCSSPVQILSGRVVCVGTASTIQWAGGWLTHRLPNILGSSLCP